MSKELKIALLYFVNDDASISTQEAVLVGDTYYPPGIVEAGLTGSVHGVHDRYADLTAEAATLRKLEATQTEAERLESKAAGLWELKLTLIALLKKIKSEAQS